MRYAFRKVYADVVTADGTVGIVYATWVCVLGSWQRRAGVELYRPDGRREVFHSVDPPAPLDAGAVPSTIALPLASGHAELSYEVVHGAFEPREPFAQAMRWRVEAARTRARLRLAGVDLEGLGYVDWVELTRPTRLLGLRTLAWGRVHLGPRTVVFGALELEDGRRVDVAARWEAPHGAAEQLGVQLGCEHGVYQIRTFADGTSATLALVPRRTLHAGAAFDRERVPARLDRLVSRVVGGATTETRWLSSATSVPGSGAETGWALHERVAFGRAAREAPGGPAGP